MFNKKLISIGTVKTILIHSVHIFLGMLFMVHMKVSWLNYRLLMGGLSSDSEVVEERVAREGGRHGPVPKPEKNVEETTPKSGQNLGKSFSINIIN